MVDAARLGDARRAVVERRQLPRRAARARRHARRARAHAAARPPGHPRDAPDARRAGRDGRAAARRDALRAGGRRHVDHHRAPRRVQPRDPGPARRRGAQRVADLRRRRPPGPARARATGSAARPPTRSAPRSRASCPSYAGIERSARRPATRSRSAARGCAKAASSRRPTARRTSPSSRRTSPTCPRAGSCCRPGGASSSTRWCGPERDPLTGAARDALFLADADAAALGVARRRRGARAQRARRAARAGAPRADPARQRAGVLPRGEPVAVADGARAALGRARLQRGRRGGPGPMTPETLLDCFDEVAARGARRGRRRSTPTTRRARTDVPGQYALDLVADAAALAVLREAAGAHRERGVGRARARGRDDHRRARSRRRLDQLLARHLVLGDLDLRARRRRPARRARREPGDRRAHDRDPRRGRVPRRRRAAARRA